MPAGFESFRDGGGYQIVSDTPMLSLDRVVVVTGGPLDPDKGYSTAFVWMENGEMVSVHTGGKQVAVIGKYNSNLMLAVMGESYPSIECYVFRPHRPSGQNFGMQIFDGAGNMTYDSGRAPFNIVAETWGPSPDYWLPAGRKYAVVVASTFVEIETFVVYTGVGVQVDYMTFETCSTDFFRTFHDRVMVERLLYHQVVRGPYPYSQPTSVQNYKANNNQPSRFFVVDVTNYS